MIPFDTAFKALTGHSPMRGQERLFAHLCADEHHEALDLPTGLGKTSVMAIWLIARALEPDASLPRRLVYVVDRRAVVDQATAEADKLAKALNDVGDSAIAELRGRLGLHEPEHKLPISTLRGQFADNRLWLDDPTATAIIVGTVDMIGSRLLFSGYGVSPRMRPVHAALLGADALIVLDEAHLVPPFHALIEQVGRQTADDAKRGAALIERICQRPAEGSKRAALLEPMRTMALSATGRRPTGKTFTLTDDDVLHDEIVHKRVNAPKWIKLHDAATGNLAETMATRVRELADGRYRVIVFCNSRKIAQDVYSRLEKALGKDSRGNSLELIVGARRVREREQLAADSAVFRRFARLPPKEGQTEPTGAAFLVATSAGEVGVDIDADHMVCDLVAWERMVQRLGRVNRRGEFVDGSLIDVFAATPDKEAEIPAGTPTIEICRKPFDSETWTKRDDGRRDASSGALRRLRNNTEFKKFTDQATTGEPLRPALTPEVLDAWAMTSLPVHTGRPKVAPWIRGWIDEEKEPPQTQLLWRRHLPIRKNDDVKQAERALALFFDAAPPHLSEILETEAFRAVDVLRARAKALLKRRSSETGAGNGTRRKEESDEAAADAGVGSDLTGQTIVAVTLAPDGSIEDLLHLDDIQNGDAKRLQALFAHRRVVLDVRLGGLAESGSLDPKEGSVPATLDGERPASIAEEVGKALWSDERLRKSGLGFRVRLAAHGPPRSPERAGDGEDWKVAFRYFIDADSNETDDADSRMEWRVEEWVGDRAAENEPALAKRPQMLKCHHARIVLCANRIADSLHLPDDLRDMLVTAARCHDSGKARASWQRYAGNPGFARDPEKYPPLAKFTTRGDPNLLKVGDGYYRHEFGSLRDAVRDNAFGHLAPALQMLGLHVIATHHGNARPMIFAYDEEDLEGIDSIKLAEQLRANVPLLVSQWGPWGLAWWEALLRAADVAASREKPEQEGR